MTQTFPIVEFIPRVIGKQWSETALFPIVDALPQCTAKGPWIAGGCLRRTISGTSLESDIDVFFADEAQLTAYATRLGVLGFAKKRETEHHEQWEGRLVGTDIVIQLIRFQYYVSASEVIDSFDFTICQFAYGGGEITCADFALWDLGRKRLAVNKITFPISSMRRMLKYARQGFTACDECLAALATAISDNPALVDNMNIRYVD